MTIITNRSGVVVVAVILVVRLLVAVVVRVLLVVLIGTDRSRGSGVGGGQW